MIWPIVNETPGVLRLFLRIGQGGAFVALGGLVFMTVLSYQSFATAKRFETEGLQTVATVARAYKTERESDGKITTEYNLDLTFMTEDGRKVAISEQVSKVFFETSERQTTLDIWYLEGKPEKVELVRGSTAQSGRAQQFMALVIGVIALTTLWFPGRKAVDAYLARQYGREGKATILEVVEHQFNKSGVWHRLMWRDTDGQVGYSLMYRPSQLSDYGPMTTLRVYHGRKWTWWEGDVGTRA